MKKKYIKFFCILIIVCFVSRVSCAEENRKMTLPLVLGGIGVAAALISDDEDNASHYWDHSSGSYRVEDSNNGSSKSEKIVVYGVSGFFIGILLMLSNEYNKKNRKFNILPMIKTENGVEIVRFVYDF